MIKKSLAVTALLVAGVLAAPASAATFDLPLDNTFDGMRINWTGASRGTSTIVYKVVEYEGKAAVCGGFFYEGSNVLSQLTRESLRSSRIEISGNIVKQNLGYFSRINIDDAVDTITVRCKTGRMVWHPSFENREPELISNQSNFEY